MEIVVKQNSKQKTFEELENGAIFKCVDFNLTEEEDEFYLKAKIAPMTYAAIGLTTFTNYAFAGNTLVIPLDATLEIVDVV